MKLTAQKTSLILAAVALGVLAACDGQGPGGLDGSAPVVEDASGREPVPEIEIVAKTQANDPARYELTRLVADAWVAAGISTTMLPVGDAQLNQKTATSKDFDVYTIGYAGTPERLDPDNFLGRFHSDNAQESGSNYSMYADPEYDEAYTLTVTASTEDERVAAVREAQQILFEDHAVAPVVHPSQGSAYRSDRWKGLEITAATPVTSTYNAVNAEPTQGQTELVWGTNTNPTTLNPVRASNNQDLVPLQLIYDTALSFDTDGDLVENAAASWETEAESVQLTVRDGLEFTNGDPVTADDFAFTLEYMKEQGAPLFATTLETMEDVTVDGQEVTVTFSEPAGSFPAVVLANMPILPERIWSQYESADEAGREDLIGSGPFVLEDYSVDESVSFRANERSRRVPNVDALSILILGSFDAAAGALESGQIDMINPAETVSSQYEQLDGVDGVEVVDEEIHGWTGLHYNTTSGPLSHPAFREALTYLIPVEDIVDIVYQGEASPAGSVIAPTLDTWHNGDIEPIGYDVERAMQALEEGGFVYDESGQLYYPEGWDGEPPEQGGGE
ncbi:ABC transporter substrate-binding protein [Aeromicrobium sp. CTD01-1L150]|uniref:ABC transporter substrate-binding protein n=1 Tax=Aeromicrobium sp. CTD01-1L150 TaxID=3341830 RepID=UPI0035C075EA